MPIRVKKNILGASADYGNPFVGPINHTVQLAVPIGALTSGEVDAKGYLKPGLPLTAAGAKVALNGVVHGVVVEATKVAESNIAADLTAAGTQRVAVARRGMVNGDIIEDNLGRVLDANERAGFALAGSYIALITP